MCSLLQADSQEWCTGQDLIWKGKSTSAREQPKGIRTQKDHDEDIENKKAVALAVDDDPAVANFCQKVVTCRQTRITRRTGEHREDWKWLKNNDNTWHKRNFLHHQHDQSTRKSAFSYSPHVKFVARFSHHVTATQKDDHVQIREPTRHNNNHTRTSSSDEKAA